MRSSPVILLTLAAVSAPIYAAPLKPTICDRFPQACQAEPVFLRDDYDSEAINWPGLAKTAGKALPTIIGALPTVIGWFHHDDSSNSTRRDLEELVLRADADDESGAIDLDTIIHYGKVLIPPVWNGVKQLIDEHHNASAQAQRREIVEVLARAGIVNLNNVLSLWPVSVNSTVSNSSANDQQQQPVNYRPHFNFPWSIKQSTPTDNATSQQRREIVDVLARAAVDAVYEDLGLKPHIVTSYAGPALNFNNWMPGKASAPLTPTAQQQRREFVEVLARAVAEADESDAISLSSIWNIAKGAWNVGKTIFDSSSSSDSQQQQQRRDDTTQLLRRIVLGTPTNLPFNPFLGHIGVTVPPPSATQHYGVVGF